jgi:hypothetical protein
VTGSGIEREISWELLNLSVHTNINGHTTPPRTRPRPSANTGTVTGTVAVTASNVYFDTTIPLSATETEVGVGGVQQYRRTRNRSSRARIVRAMRLMSHRRQLFHQNNISSAGWKRPFQQISDPEPGHLLAFDQSRELVDSVDDDDDMGWV